ncbi:S1/P1 nuclease [Sphingomonas psychrotolerans]|uniref:S1/P1 nuclease n=1 Tax=Sphingomonas psychrotolerans TaxID=1327635 RepID=A0ABU3N5Y7_9SPHN|nr:S1/P1 nuclease [Sphingomonas psychrotolerans]MDT8759907.1 S1/P1 nuclease [Sphingomonas psychrotolerans]
MIRKLLLPLLAVLAAFLPAQANAYWEYGHETVAAIAYRNVTPAVRAEIGRLLKHQALLETPTCPARTIEQASVWPDCIKELGPRFSYAYNWHYQNVNICKDFTLKGNCPDGNCVSAQIDRATKLLKDRTVPLRERVMALAFLVHFVGDLHQPLHAGDRGDLGGNRAKSTYGVYSTEKLNLHSIWDGLLAERAISTPPSLVRVYSPAERAAVNGGSVEDWSRDSWQVARDVAYASAYGDPCGPVPERAKLDEATIEKLIEPARQQMVKGGLRLARLLDESLG